MVQKLQRLITGRLFSAQQNYERDDQKPDLLSSHHQPAIHNRLIGLVQLSKMAADAFMC